MAQAENDDFKVEIAVLQFNSATKQADYAFGIHVKRGGPPRSVKVDDVSDEEPSRLLETDHVSLDHGHWKAQSEPFVPDAQNAKWLFEIDKSIRVYRFTVVTSDGRSDVLYQGCPYTVGIKEYLRKQLPDQPPAPVP